jgi:hypothetical protein
MIFNKVFNVTNQQKIKFYRKIQVKENINS